MTGIFMESNEKLGLLYNRYKDIPDITDKFINDLFSSNNDSEISNKLNDYKRTVKGIIKSPEPINPRSTKKERQRIKEVKSKTESLINNLKKLIEYNNKKYNACIGSAIKWIQRVIIDTLNLCDQDLNILSLIDKVYYKKIYESDCSNIMTECNDVNDFMELTIDNKNIDIFNNIYESYFEFND